MRRAGKKGAGRKGRAKLSKPAATPIDPRFGALFRQLVQVGEENGGLDSLERLLGEAGRAGRADDAFFGVGVALSALGFKTLGDSRKRARQFVYPTAGNHGK
jgi:hypothetical protein